MYAMHQIAKYLSDPRQSHGEAILYLVRYLKKTCNLELKIKPNPMKGFECYYDSNFSGNWNREFAPMDPSTTKSQSRWIIFYAGCPISWASKLQPQIALSTTEAEYIAMLQALHVRSFPSWTYYRKWGSKTSRSFVSNLMTTARYLNIMQDLYNLQGF